MNQDLEPLTAEEELIALQEEQCKHGEEIISQPE